MQVSIPNVAEPVNVITSPVASPATSPTTPATSPETQKSAASSSRTAVASNLTTSAKQQALGSQQPIAKTEISKGPASAAVPTASCLLVPARNAKGLSSAARTLLQPVVKQPEVKSVPSTPSSAKALIDIAASAGRTVQVCHTFEQQSPCSLYIVVLDMLLHDSCGSQGLC